MRKIKPWDDRIGRRLKLRDLHILLTVAQCGSMGKAAARLAVSQPAVSKAIAEMEHTLQVRLLDRTAHGIIPTLYGRALLKWGLAVFDDLRQAVKEIEFLADPTAGEVRIGTTEAMTAGLVPAVIDRLARRYPRIVFTVTPAPTIALQYHDLRERRVDLVLGRMASRIADDDLNAEVLFNEQASHVLVEARNRPRKGKPQRSGLSSSCRARQAAPSRSSNWPLLSDHRKAASPSRPSRRAQGISQASAVIARVS